ncbi:MAG TPA: MFS transporter [Thermoanaerobaculia bacterium]|nr:MFS transporter [Thermoanaerobaculia bacterium]
MTKWAALLFLSMAILPAMGLWFCVSAVSPQIVAEWHLDSATTAWLTLSVQLGFVVGTLLSATLNLPDVIRPRHLVTLCAILAAIDNALLAAFAHSAGVTVALRFLTGAFLAGVYPPGMKLIASWFREGRGLALGTLIGALTVGQATPYLLNAFGSSSWRVNVAIASLLAIVGAIVMAIFVREGPFALPNQPFDFSQIAQVFTNRGVRLANFGYFGHMWELYAMWTWAPVMIRASLAASGDPPMWAEAASFVVIGAGAAGCIAAGRLADRLGRTVIASAAMAVSGLCCIIIGFLFGHSPLALLIVAAIWGATVVADSAQFSACVTELSDARYMGTALTMQTCVGFLITMVSIRLMPPLVDRIGWSHAFAVLAVGPFLGIVAMMRLRSAPEAVKIAQGRR